MMNKNLMEQFYLPPPPCPTFEPEPINFEFIWKELIWPELKGVYNDRRFFELLHIDY